MKYKIINTGDYLLIIDESNNSGKKILHTNSDGTKYIYLLAHLPLNNSPILKSVDLLPPIDKIPTGFKCEIIDTSNMGLTLSYPLTKTTINNGLTQWVGEYIY
jgi:hypothetical protein